MTTGTTAPKVTRNLKGRVCEAEWAKGDEQFVVLTVRHAQTPGALVAVLRRERREVDGGMESRIFAPFQDQARIAYRLVKRYTQKELGEFFDQQLERVETVRAGGDDVNVEPIRILFENPTEA